VDPDLRDFCGDAACRNQRLRKPTDGRAEAEHRSPRSACSSEVYRDCVTTASGTPSLSDPKLVYLPAPAGMAPGIARYARGHGRPTRPRPTRRSGGYFASLGRLRAAGQTGTGRGRPPTRTAETAPPARPGPDRTPPLRTLHPDELRGLCRCSRSPQPTKRWTGAGARPLPWPHETPEQGISPPPAYSSAESGKTRGFPGSSPPRTQDLPSSRP
jgi:hypothetical protein